MHTRCVELTRILNLIADFIAEMEHDILIVMKNVERQIP